MNSVKLTPQELDHILILISNNMREGWYCGRKDWWDKRNNSILEKLNKAFEEEVSAKPKSK